ncbi:MAG TPA: hypothetical protein VFT22_13180 [Kofleriaceae bacterium]|nr:hypothetical protein [Kofleriaceae bacterium]
MTRLTRLVTACALTGVLVGSAGAAMVACGGRPGSPGELPPMAPRPGAGDPTATPLPGPRRPAALLVDAGAPISPGPVSPGPVSRARGASVVPTPEFAPVVGVALDAGPPSDSYSPPLPPLPDSSVPADSRLEPRMRD